MKRLLLYVLFTMKLPEIDCHTGVPLLPSEYESKLSKKVKTEDEYDFSAAGLSYHISNLFWVLSTLKNKEDLVELQPNK